MKAALALSITVAAFLLVGCSHSASTHTPTAVTSPSSATAPAPSPSPTPLDLVEAQERYMDLTIPAEAAITAYDKAIKQHKDWRILRTYVRKLTAAVTQEAKAVQAVQWPANVQPAATRWATALNADAALLNRAAKATTESGFFAAAHKALGTQSNAAEGKVVHVLGL